MTGESKFGRFVPLWRLNTLFYRGLLGTDALPVFQTVLGLAVEFDELNGYWPGGDDPPDGIWLEGQLFPMY